MEQSLTHLSRSQLDFVIDNLWQQIDELKNELQNSIDFGGQVNIRDPRWKYLYNISYNSLIIEYVEGWKDFDKSFTSFLELEQELVDANVIKDEDRKSLEFTEFSAGMTKRSYKAVTGNDWIHNNRNLTIISHTDTEHKINIQSQQEEDDYLEKFSNAGSTLQDDSRNFINWLNKYNCTTGININYVFSYWIACEGYCMCRKKKTVDDK